jgi:hypothetical protein
MTQSRRVSDKCSLAWSMELRLKPYKLSLSDPLT